jgi:signal transduction histidine kinase
MGQGREHEAAGSISVSDDFRFLAEASARLASSLDYHETLLNVATLLVTRVCDLAGVFLLDGDVVRVAAWDHADSEMKKRLMALDFREVTSGFSKIVLQVIDSGQSLVLDSVTPEFLDSIGVGEDKKRQYAEAGVNSLILAPMMSHGQCLGVLSCVSTSDEHPIDPSDVPLVEEIARRAATAVDHARLYERTKRAEEVQRYLNEASVTLASSLDYETTLANVASVLVPSVADWIAVHLYEEGQAKRVTVAHSDPEKVSWAISVSDKYPTDMSLDTGLPHVLKTGASEFYPAISEEMMTATARDEEHLAVIRQLKVGSALIVPMVARDEVIGAITFVAEQQGRYSEVDLEFAKELARRSALAVDKARLFRNVEQMVEERTHELQAVNKELEAFAYSVSHDLRAPLRSIMSASMIVMEDYGDKIGEDGQAELKRASAAAKRMSGLIDDLLEYSRLGRREMNVGDVDLSALAALIARETGIPEEAIQVAPGMHTQGDPALLRVALTNLIENAWKFTKSKSAPSIEVGRTIEQGQDAYFVRDNGVGFDEQYAGKLFVPFERLHSPQDYPGTGIGLANVKRIVARHGGKVWAHGTQGQGATFYFTLGK